MAQAAIDVRHLPQRQAGPQLWDDALIVTFPTRLTIESALQSRAKIFVRHLPVTRQLGADIQLSSSLCSMTGRANFLPTSLNIFSGGRSQAGREEQMPTGPRGQERTARRGRQWRLPSHCAPGRRLRRSSHERKRAARPKMADLLSAEVAFSKRLGIFRKQRFGFG